MDSLISKWPFGKVARENDRENLSGQLPRLHPAGSHTVSPTALFHFLTADLLSAAFQADKWISPVRNVHSALNQCQDYIAGLTVCSVRVSIQLWEHKLLITPLSVLTANHKWVDRGFDVTHYQLSFVSVCKCPVFTSQTRWHNQLLLIRRWLVLILLRKITTRFNLTDLFKFANHLKRSQRRALCLHA